ncbi:hypothetical protein AA15973_1741 [Komagataeibacter sucrofermentans DSM 15973]|nr:hypothetical protein AA15973_1741 [Komagataeibacter sucrofermentans DSM 15973]
MVHRPGPTGVPVNVAGRIRGIATGGGSGLNVFAHEPDVPEALRTSPRTVLQPHRASATVETRLAMGKLVVANLAAHFARRPPPTPVV